MSLSTVSTGQAVSHNDINQAINVLQQPSGGSEVGKYILSGNCYIAGGFISQYIPSLSRTTVPVSVSIDTADVTASAWMNAPGTSKLTMGGVQFFTSYTSANGAGVLGGNITFNY